MCPHCVPPTPLPGSGQSGLTRRDLLRATAVTAGAVSLGGCERVPFRFVSDETVEQLGLETWQRILSEMPRSSDETARARVAEVAQRLLLTAGESPSRWEIQVFARPEVNAFVLPGRKIGVLEGMLRIAQSDGELAAVIGHEIGHLQAEHSAERLSAELVRQWGLRLVSFALQLGDVQYANEIAALLGLGVEFGLVLPYSRRQELEADRLGLLTMAKAGFDPRAAVRLWQRMEQVGGQGVAILSTHPAPRARIEAIESMIPEVTGAAALSAIGRRAVGGRS